MGRVFAINPSELEFHVTSSHEMGFELYPSIIGRARDERPRVVIVTRDRARCCRSRELLRMIRPNVSIGIDLRTALRLCCKQPQNKLIHAESDRGGRYRAQEMWCEAAVHARDTFLIMSLKHRPVYFKEPFCIGACRNLVLTTYARVRCQHSRCVEQITRRVTPWGYAIQTARSLEAPAALHVPIQSVALPIGISFSVLPDAALLGMRTAFMCS